MQTKESVNLELSGSDALWCRDGTQSLLNALGSYVSGLWVLLKVACFFWVSWQLFSCVFIHQDACTLPMCWVIGIEIVPELFLCVKFRDFSLSYFFAVNLMLNCVLF
jgi:hypothetical protein